MSRQSTRARQSTRSCLACDSGEIVRFLHQKCYPSKFFRGSAPNPAGGSTPPDPHLQSTLFAAGYVPGSLSGFFFLKLRSSHVVFLLVPGIVEDICIPQTSICFTTTVYFTFGLQLIFSFISFTLSASAFFLNFRWFSSVSCLQIHGLFRIIEKNWKLNFVWNSLAF